MLCKAYLNVVLDEARDPCALSQAIQGIAAQFIAGQKTTISLNLLVGKNRRLLDLIGPALDPVMPDHVYKGNLLDQVD